MKCFAITVFLILSLCAASRAQETAGASYAGNGTMIGITNLSALSDCTSASVTGKIKKVEIAGDLATVNIDVDKSNELVSVPLNRLKADERAVIFKQLLKKKFTVRVSGYRCNTDDPITAFSIDRIYKVKK